MAYYSDTISRPAALLARAQSAFETLAQRYAQYRVYRETFNSLNELSNRDLADLGLSRSGLRAVALEAAYN